MKIFAIIVISTLVVHMTYHLGKSKGFEEGFKQSPHSPIISEQFGRYEKLIDDCFKHIDTITASRDELLDMLQEIATEIESKETNNGN